MGGRHSSVDASAKVRRRCPQGWSRGRRVRETVRWRGCGRRGKRPALKGGLSVPGASARLLSSVGGDKKEKEKKKTGSPGELWVPPCWSLSCSECSGRGHGGGGELLLHSRRRNKMGHASAPGMLASHT